MLRLGVTARVHGAGNIQAVQPVIVRGALKTPRSVRLQLKVNISVTAACVVEPPPLILGPAIRARVLVDSLLDVLGDGSSHVRGRHQAYGAVISRLGCDVCRPQGQRRLAVAGYRVYVAVYIALPALDRRLYLDLPRLAGTFTVGQNRVRAERHAVLSCVRFDPLQNPGRREDFLTAALGRIDFI